MQSNAPIQVSVREYDPEIKDIASFVHNTPIDSDLAVCEPFRIVDCEWNEVQAKVPVDGGGPLSVWQMGK